MKINTVFLIAALSVVLTLSLSACGIKPNRLDAPTPEKTKDFPAEYPQTIQ